MTRLLGLIVLAIACSVAVGCGGDDETTSASTSSSSTTSTTTEAAEPTSSENVNEDFGFLPPDIEVDEREGTPPPAAGESDVAAAAEAANCEYSGDLFDEGNKHFTDPEQEPEYKTSPPTSGDHFFSVNEVGSGAIADGAFLDQAPDNRVVHSLEHGRVAVQYGPDLPEEDQLALKGLFDSDRPGLLLFPNADMPYEVGATAWTALLSCETYAGEATIAAIAAFRDEFRGQGPEPVTF